MLLYVRLVWSKLVTAQKIKVGIVEEDEGSPLETLLLSTVFQKPPIDGPTSVKTA